MKPEIQKRVSKEQFAKACKENRSIAALCRNLEIVSTEALRLEGVYDIYLPRKDAYRRFDHDKIYATYLENMCDSRKTANIIGCHIATVAKVVREREKNKT